MHPTRKRSPSVGIIGAGPAGLTAAYLLARQGSDVLVVESDPQYVGGISKTVQSGGFRFDIGGHRFFSKSQEVEDFWTEILPDDMLDRPRSSRIYYRNLFFSYPLKAMEALSKLGFVESTLCVLSYVKARLFPVRNPVSLEDWVTNQFGARLFNLFFKTYTEKVWGMSCKEISADWAAQRIKGLSLFSAIVNALALRRPLSKQDVIKTLIDTFRYPRLGPGMLWEACADKVRSHGGRIVMGQKVEGLRWDEAGSAWKLRTRDHEWAVEHVISSSPLRELVHAIEPPLSEAARESASALGYRDFLTVTLVFRGPEAFTDNWIYIHDPSVKVGRIQNFKSWSPEMVPDPSCNCYGLEYFCFEGDGLWNRSDEDLIAFARAEMGQLGLAREGAFLRGHVVRQPKAYPVYDEHYQRHVQNIRSEIEAKLPTLHLVGRNGMHKYNNQDHAIMTAMLTVKNILAGERVYDVWRVNQDAEYHESGERPANGASGLRSVPEQVSRQRRQRIAS